MGLILILLTGLAWGAIGVVMGFVSRRKLNVLTFITVATTLSALASWCFLVDWSCLLRGNVDRAYSLVTLLAVGGIAGSLGMLSLQKSMSGGAAAWTVGQSAMVIPFLTGILFLGEDLRIAGGLGVAGILLSLLAFAKGEKCSDREAGEVTTSWLRYALIAFCLLGAQQAISSIPSSWEGWSDTARLRVPLVLTAGALPLLLMGALRRLRVERAVWGLALAYAALVVAGQFLLFTAMDHLCAEGRLSLAFPLALGTCILLVALWDIVVWKRHPKRMTIVGMCLGLTGVILLAL